MKTFILKSDNREKIDDSEFVISNFSLPEAKSHLIKKPRINWVNIIISIASFLFLTIMVLTKLWPCIKSSWTQDFCNSWNDFWFSLSSSFIAAIIFYFFFSLIPKRERRKEIEPLINYEICSVLVHLNIMFANSIRKMFTLEILKEDFINGIVEKIDWGKKYSYYSNGLVQKTFLDCLTTEIILAKTKLEDILLRYKNFFTSEELSILSQDILHHKVFASTDLHDDSTVINDENVKKAFASEVYDFYWKLIDFSTRFKTHGNVIFYGW